MVVLEPPWQPSPSQPLFAASWGSMDPVVVISSRKSSPKIYLSRVEFFSAAYVHRELQKIDF
jgi:hypothetical protein